MVRHAISTVSTNMPITSFISSQFGDEDDIYGKKPIVPEFPDFGEAVAGAVDSNIANLPRIEDLARRSTDLYRSLLDQASPGATGLMDLGTANIKSMLEGELPKDVEERIRRYGAEAGVGSGTSGSEFSGNRTARDLGLTSLDLATRGLASAERWIAQAKSNTFDFSKMFLGPEHAIRQAEGTFQRDWLQAQVDAAPDPGARGAFDSEMAFIGMVLSAYGGGAGYTQGYQQQTQPQPPNPGDSGGGGGSSYFGPAYGSTYQGYGGNMYQSVPTDHEGGGASWPF